MSSFKSNLLSLQMQNFSIQKGRPHQRKANFERLLLSKAKLCGRKGAERRLLNQYILELRAHLKGRYAECCASRRRARNASKDLIICRLKKGKSRKCIKILQTSLQMAKN